MRMSVARFTELSKMLVGVNGKEVMTPSFVMYFAATHAWED
jgi:hypothetical protein